MTRLKTQLPGIVRWLAALATLALAGALCLACLKLYGAGTASQNLTAEGVRMEDIFTRDNVGEALGRLAPLAAAWALLMLLAALLPGEEPRRAPRPIRSGGRPAPGGGLPMGGVRILLAVAAAALLGAGILNGGLYDVLVKAINICTECIGLG